MGILVHLENINKSYIDGRVRRDILLDLNLQIKENEFVAIRGKSGSGKTTLLSIIGMQTTSINGIFKLEGNNVSNLTERDRNELRLKKIGFIFQTFNLFEDLTVEENVQLPLIGLGLKMKVIKQKSRDVLKKVDMEDRRKSYPTILSGGEQQRIGVARAIVTNPILLLADEPTGNLDLETEQIVMELLIRLNSQNKSAICLVSHDIKCQALADRCLTLRKGKLFHETNQKNKERLPIRQK